MNAICNYAYIPVRNEPSESAEMETQILYGETFSVLETRDKWKRIRIDFDGYEGWIDAKLLTTIDNDTYNAYIAQKRHIVSKAFTSIEPNDYNHSLIITGGSEVLTPTPSPMDNVIETARLFLGAPYLWGGRTFFGIDCSGFSQIVYKIHGLAIPRNASQQVKLGTTVNFLKEIQPGDLAFFGDDESKITHVGICIDNNTIIHASGCVRIDTLDHHGIYNKSRQCYTHSLRVIKRLL